MADKKVTCDWFYRIRFFLRSTAYFACVRFVFALSPVVAQEYTPEHDTVKKMIADGINFLSSDKLERTRNGPGYDILMGYTAMKATEDHDHKLVKLALPGALKLAEELRKDKKGSSHSAEINYDASVAAMFFAALDPDKYRTEIESIRDYLIANQRKSGSYGYSNELAGSLGDISQSQYVALAFWSIKQANIEVDPAVIEKLTVWIASAQQPNGNWVYQTPPRAEDIPTHQMSAAGLSAILVCADAIGVLRGAGGGLMEEEDEDEEIPRAFRRVVKEDKKGNANFVPKIVTRAGVKKKAENAKSWFDKNKYKRGGDWFYYLIYSQERYESFLEILSGKRSKSPDWYNSVVKVLLKNQAASGGWGVEGDSDPGGCETATCFSILFLLRNTQKSIGDIKTADSVGGYGLGNVAEVGFIDGKLVDKSQVSSIEDAIKLLEDSKDGSTEDKLLADRMALDTDPKKKREQLNRFARLLRSPDARARRVAAKLLGRGDDLDFAPDLIFALSEGEQDGQVLRIAENSLRILSRQLTTYILPREGLVTPSDRVKSERHWQNWYLTIRPDYIFIDQ